MILGVVLTEVKRASLSRFPDLQKCAFLTPFTLACNPNRGECTGLFALRAHEFLKSPVTDERNLMSARGTESELLTHRAIPCP